MALETALNWMSWPVVGDVANITQLTGLDAVQLIGMIGTAANNARMHKKNCLQFAHHLKLISNLLEKVTLSELTPETQEALALFENALRKALVLVQHCSNKSYIYLVAMGWVYVNKFRECQDEIDRYLNLIPLISLVEGSRVSSSYVFFCLSCKILSLDMQVTIFSMTIIILYNNIS
jgi:hypothetical protein